MITLVLGGARSGKSAYAERVAKYLGGAPQHCCYLATGEAFDEEMKLRIAKHQERRGQSFFTVEEPVNLSQACRQLPPSTRVVLLDCLTTWMGNISYRRECALAEGEASAEAKGAKAAEVATFAVEDSPEVQAWLEYLPQAPCDVVMVSNELGLGLIPGDAYSREFRDSAGRLNQKVAAVADNVYFMVAGLPLVLKGELLPLP